MITAEVRLINAGWREDPDDSGWWWPPGIYVGPAYTIEEALREMEGGNR